MMWKQYFDRIFVINLPDRIDRLLRVTKLLNNYGIPFEVFDATPHEVGYLGLAQTMRNLFVECRDVRQILVFEDDVQFVVPPDELHDVMNKCLDDLTELNCQMFYLGLQHSQTFKKWITPNLLLVEWGQSTHAVAYGRHAMDFYLDHVIKEPVDNFWVKNYQKYHTSFCSFPLLATQADGFSDICGEFLSWDMYIRPQFEKYVRDILPLRDIMIHIKNTS